MIIKTNEKRKSFSFKKRTYKEINPQFFTKTKLNSLIKFPSPNIEFLHIATFNFPILNTTRLKLKLFLKTT